MPDNLAAARRLALAFLTAEWNPQSMAEHGRRVLGLKGSPKWILRLAEKVCRQYPSAPPPTQLELARLLATSGRLRQATRRREQSNQPVESGTLLLPPIPMRPVAGLPAGWELPNLTSAGQLAAWLDITPDELDWFADIRRLQRDRPPGPARHYQYRWIPKAGGQQRLLESPRPRLKQVQRRLLHGLLDRIPPHPAACAFRRGHSLAGFLSPHAGRRILLHVDLRHFFPSTSSARVHALFRTVGYPEGMARLLTGLCTTSAPRQELHRPQDREAEAALDRLYGSPHLPQGAPTSPALANLCARGLDVRLHGLARHTGANYTRYADDLLFSGGHELERMLSRFRFWVFAIAIDEGFTIRHRKTRELPRSGRQQVAGVVLNQKLNQPRAEYDRLRATLHNCIRHGAASQNRSGHPRFREHLGGRIAWVNMLNPNRGARLKQLYQQIDWPEESTSNPAADSHPAKPE